MKTAPKRIALVTGAAGEIGGVTARRLSGEGYGLILVDQSADVINFRDELGGGDGAAIVEGHVLDVSDADAVDALCSDLLERHGCIDVLINNAGIQLRANGKKTPALEVSVADFERIIAVNLLGPFLFTRRLAPAMVKKGWGRIINMSSLGGRVASRFNGMHYSASKAGLIGMTRTLALEVSRSGVTANAIAPGRIATEANKRFGTDQAVIDALIPAGRLGTADEVAGVVSFLASDDAAYITGVTIDVNGGFYMG